MELTFLYPEGKLKALTFSYDDGVAQDRRLIEIFNRSGMKGTFNLNAGLQDSHNNKIHLNELNTVYAGHEIACHGKLHPFMERQPLLSRVEDVLEDRKILEQAVGKIVNGMAYPYGTYDSRVIHTLTALGIVYSRTVRSTGGFGLPDNFLEWHPTCHHRENMAEIGKRFLAGSYPLALFYVWGHSYEFDNNNNWNIIEDFCAQMAGQENIWYAANMEIYEYVTALRSVVTSADGRIVKNPSALSVWLRTEDYRVLEVKSGQTLAIF
ncbi:MAG: Polysaccharide deacetylase [Lentisphaerae bacterium ADurb.Bin242]|nr:MAG: Polysaccharide deacetylase [Lentisphaerae bacterium ADurb.Bin242]